MPIWLRKFYIKSLIETKQLENEAKTGKKNNPSKSKVSSPPTFVTKQK